MSKKSLIAKKNNNADNGGGKTYPAVEIRKSVVFPGEKAPLVLYGKESIETANSALNDSGLVVLIFKKNGEESRMGVLAKVLQYWYLTPVNIGMVVEGLRRVKVKNIFTDKNVRKADAIDVVEKKLKNDEAIELEALSRSVFDQFKSLIQAEGVMPAIVAEGEFGKGYPSPDRVSDVVSSALDFGFKEKIDLLEETEAKARLEILKAKLAKELSIVKTEKKIQSEVEREMGKAQREFILRERLKAIEKELGMDKEQEEYSQIEQKIKQADLPKNVEEVALKELYHLKKIPPFGAEAPYIRSYLDWIAELPWSKKSETQIDLEKSKAVLDEDHYGLNKAKERVLEYLAVQKLAKGKKYGSILCFVGPPGTGKTSVGQSIARAIGRNFVRVSLGGIKDEAEIRGHRRTYVGALPGRIIQGIRNAKTKNPVFMLDEIDKVGADFHGDPSAALLEVLDPEQNSQFSDHYIEIPFDLSEVLFIATANVLDQISPTLKDRMEVIEFPGYTDEEKIGIAKRHLFPKVLSRHGLEAGQLTIENKAMEKIIRNYAREAGVRNLERKIAEIARKTARLIAGGKDKVKVVVTESNIKDYLGPETYEKTMKEAKDEVGVATGLAWTSSGGEIMLIEASVIPGKGNLTLTGQLGEVMQESAKAALSYIRSRSGQLKIKPDFFYKSDVHVHVPSGAIPKDGPSAGIAIATALASALTKKKAKKEVALTGEITLSGKVLPIGGMKEKVLAAHAAGVETVVLPVENEKNMIDVPEEARKELKFKFVKHMDEVLKIALIDK